MPKQRAVPSGDRQIGKFPRHSLEKVLRVPRALLDQNAGKESSDADVAKFLGVKLTGPTRVEISSALKFGLLERPSSGRLKITEPPRVSRRPHFLRGWGHGKSKQVRTGGAGAGGSHGRGAPSGA